MNSTRISLHVLFWAVYLPINAVLACVLHRQPIHQVFFQALFAEAFILPVKLLLVYFFFYYIVPLYLDRDKLAKLIGLSLLTFLATVMLYRIMTVWIYYPFIAKAASPPFWSVNLFLLSTFDIFITLATAVTIKMIRLHYRSVDHEQELKREKLQSELSFLRAQTNPHFLFNTLNNLYGLARKKAPETPDAILKLSKIMRFVIYECLKPMIPIAEETRVIQDYIELEKLRYNNRLVVDYQEDVDDGNTMIAPLLLLPFVENSFKHGASGTTGNVEIRIRIFLREADLRFSVQNTFDSEREKNNPEGIGLKNVQRQLELLYPKQHQLDISQINNTFSVQLNISLTV
ncbi:MAG: histidine kinase [Saprospiraceae bacterium]|nr:histidine kinase [Saprospiraceae bacterium]